MADDDDRCKSGNYTLCFNKIFNNSIFYLEVFEPPKAAGRRIDEDIGEKDEFGARDYTALTLKNDHANRPIWVVSAIKRIF